MEVTLNYDNKTISIRGTHKINDVLDKIEEYKRRAIIDAKWKIDMGNQYVYNPHSYSPTLSPYLTNTGTCDMSGTCSTVCICNTTVTTN